MVLWSRDQHYSFTRTMATKLGRVLTSGMRFSTQMLKLSPTSCFISLKYFIINSFQQINFLTSLKHNRDLFPLSWTWSVRYHICIQMNHNWRFLKINCYINWIDPTFVFLDFALPVFLDLQLDLHVKQLDIQTYIEFLVLAYIFSLRKAFTL